MRSARIEKPGELAPMQLRRNQDNQWQVVLDHIEWDEEVDHYYPPPIPYMQQPGLARAQAMASIRAARSKAVVDAFKQTQARIDSGDLNSAAAAQAELMGKLAAASVEAAKAKAAIPSNRFFKDRP